MINSKGSVVVGDERAQAGLVGVVVVRDRAGESEQTFQHAGGHAGVGTSPVLFEVELAFEGVLDRFDQLAQRFEQPGTGTGLLLALAGRTRVAPRSPRKASNSAL